MRDEHPLARVMRKYGLGIEPLNGVAFASAGAARGAQSSPDVGGHRYADVALERECAAVRQAPPGTRNDTLNRAAFSMGTLVGAGLLDADRAHVALTLVGRGCGLDSVEVERTIRSGLDTGVRSPRSVAALGNPPGVPTSPNGAPGEWATSGGGVAEQPGGDREAGLAGEPGAGPRRTWLPEDLAPILAGSQAPPVPSVGARSDGVGLFYPGRVHSIASESEAGKTWLLLHCVATELSRGNSVMYIDFEDSAHGIVGRLTDMGVTPEVLTARFAYLRPESPINVGCNRADIGDCLRDLQPTLVGIDGVTDAMALHGLNLKDNTEISRFWSLLPRPLAATGPAVVTLDHVVKDPDSRSRYALGGVHKLNTVDGAAYLLSNLAPFGMGVVGRSVVYVAKDRPGQLRRQCLPTDEGHHFADLSVRSVMHVGDAYLDGVTLSLPGKAGDKTEAMKRRIVDVLKKAGQPLSKVGIEDRVTGNRDAIRRALAALVDSGHVEVEAGTRGSLIHRMVKDLDS